MPKKSNLYIERIYSDYPIACWALDDEVSYKQLENGGSSVGGATSVSFNPSTSEVAPVLESTNFIKIDFDNPTYIYLYDLNQIVVDPSKQDMVFSAFVYHSSPLIEKYEIGINIGGIEYFSEFSFGPNTGWKNIFDVFDVSNMSDPSAFLYIRIVPATGITGLYTYVNAVSLGQDCEEYISYTAGYSDSPIIVDEYGKNVENNGEYATDQYGAVYVRPSGMPLAYGSYQSLFVLENPTGPSITIPASGFLYEDGKYNNYTFEMWMRLINTSTYPVRIVGPINSTDGVYVQEGFISLYLGPYTQSYFVGKWYRPMLMHFEYSPTSAALFINGEKVISIDIEIEKINFPSSIEMIGIYGSDKIEYLEIDSIALYPYTMPAETAKKHFVYGQGVQEFDFSNDKFLKKTVQIDFPYAGYSYNVIYPDTVKWRAGTSSNIETSSSYIKPASYGLPQVLCQSNGKFIDQSIWLLDNYSVNNSNFDIAPYISMNPMGNYTESSIYYKTLSIIGTKVRYVFGSFKSPITPVANQTLMCFDNKQTGESLKIILNQNTLQYKFYNQVGVVTNLDILDQTIANDDYFYAGIDINEISRVFYSIVGIFFSDQNKISLSIGGNGSSIFSGRIFGISFMDNFIVQRDSGPSPVFTNGAIDQEVGLPSLIEYTGNYSLIPLYSNTSMILDIATRGYWEDYLPLSMFGKNVSTPSGAQYDLDIIQFNIDAQYKKIYESVSTMPYSVIESILAYSGQVYEDLETTYTSYNDLYDQILNIYLGLKSTAGIKTYIALQQFNEVGSKPYSDYVNVTEMSDSGILEINPANISNTKYEVFDNCCILIPKTIDFKNYYICLFLELNVRGTNTKNMIIKRCELSSLVFNDGSDTRLGTKHSIPIYAFAELLP